MCSFLNTCFIIGAVNEETSIFHYVSGLSHRDHSHPDFVPFFVDEYPEEQRNASRAACGGDSASQACIFDYLATGDKQLALSSGNTDTSNREDLVNIGIIYICHCKPHLIILIFFVSIIV